MNIIFDAGGVLFYIREFRNNIIRRVLTSSGYSSDLVEDGLIDLKQFDLDYFHTNQMASWQDEKQWLINRSNRLALFIDSDNAELADKLYMLAFDSFQYHLYDETISVLKRMKTKHKLFVLSNATASLNWAFDYLGLRPYFEDVVISSYVGLEKPDRRIYHHILNLIGDNPEKCVFVDDKMENVEAGLECGIKSFHLDRKAGMTLSNFEGYVEGEIE